MIGGIMFPIFISAYLWAFVSLWLILRNPNPRVEPAIKHVSQRIGDNVGRANRQHTALHDAIVALADAIFHQQQTETRPTENLFGNDRAGEQYSELQTQHGDHGD